MSRPPVCRFHVRRESVRIRLLMPRAEELIIRPTRIACAAALGGILVLAAACADDPPPPAQLGPHDGLELPPEEPERVAVGDVAPDFTLRAHDGRTITLADYRGSRDILLVFYRGHW
jgi:cytochrome oxidase Cu insertion factor (SCO1/SenC/PrrC family)